MADIESISENLELKIGGMSCAACAAHIEKDLNKMPGVSASVNYATEKATITKSGNFGVKDFIKTVENAGYQVIKRADTESENTENNPDSNGIEGELSALRKRLLIYTRCSRNSISYDSPTTVQLLAVGISGSRHSGNPMGSLPIPPRRILEYETGCHHHGYPDFARNLSCFHLVTFRPFSRGRRHERNDPRFPTDCPPKGGK